MKRIAFLSLALLFGVFLSCREVKENEVEEIKIENTDINKFAHSVYQNMDSTIGFAKIQLNQIMNDGQLNGDAIATSGHPLAGIIKGYYDMIFAAVNIESPIYIVAKDIDLKKGQLTEGVAILEIADESKFKTVIKDFAEVKNEGNLNHASLKNAHLVWQKNIAIVGFSNTNDGKDLVTSAFKNGAKLEESDILKDKELKNDDIFLILEAKKLLVNAASAIDNEKQELVKKAVNQLAVDAENSHIEASINFNNGEVNIHSKTHSSETLAPLLDILKNSNTNDLANGINSQNSVGNLLVNLDVNKLAKNYAAYIIDNKLSDETTSQQLNGLSQYLTGEIAINMDNIENDKAQLAVAYGKKGSGFYDLLLMQVKGSDLLIQDKRNVIYLGKNKNFTSSEVEGNEELLNNGITGRFDISKLNKEDLDGIQTAIASQLAIVEVKGNLFEMDVTIKSVNPNENILTSILQTLKANVNPNELPM